MLDCQVSQQHGSKDIVPNRLGRLVIHHRYMLVGSRVENHLWPEAIKYVSHACRTGDVPEKWHDGSAIARCEEFLLNCKNMRLRAFDQNQRTGIERKNLSTEFATDTAPGTSNHHCAGVNQTADCICLYSDRSAAEQIFNSDRSQIANTYTTGCEVAKGRHCLALQPGGTREF